MSDYTQAARKAVKLFKQKKSTSSYDDDGIVTRVDRLEGKVYVRFSDGDDETPVMMTINARVGDHVKVRTAGHKSWIIGNYTDAPIGLDEIHHQIQTGSGVGKDINERVKKEVEESGITGEDGADGLSVVEVYYEYCLASENNIPAGETFEDIQVTDWDTEMPEWEPGYYIWFRTITVLSDESTIEGEPTFDMGSQHAVEADALANSINNHFWTDSGGAVWVTKEDGSHATGYATKMASEGILHLYNDKKMFALTSSALGFYDSSDGTTPLALFGSSGVQLYSNGTNVASFTASGISFDTTIPFTIGNPAALNPSYIRWINTGTTLNPVWKIQIRADSIQVGNTPVLLDGDACEWYSGTTITGTSSTPRTFPNSGIADAKIGDMYLNTSTSNTYRCTYPGAASVANWVYVNNIKGQDGVDGRDGTDGRDGAGFEYNQYFDHDSTGTYFYGISKTGTYSNTYSIMKNDGLYVYSSGTEKARFGTTIDLTPSGRNSTGLRVRADGIYFGTYSSSSFNYTCCLSPTTGITIPDGKSICGSLYFDMNNAHFSNAVYVDGVTTCTGKLLAVWGANHPDYAANCHIGSDGYIRMAASSSSRRYKRDIDDIKDPNLDPHKLYDLRVVQFRFKKSYIKDDEKTPYSYPLIPGLIAEEVYDVYPIAVDVEDGKIETWDPKKIIPPMIKLIQEQKAMIDDLEFRISKLEHIG